MSNEEPKDQIFFRVVLEGRVHKIEHVYKTEDLIGSEAKFPSLAAKLDAIVMAITATGYTREQVEEEMREYLERRALAAE
jgi:hypothetical protein